MIEAIIIVWLSILSIVVWMFLKAFNLKDDLHSSNVSSVSNETNEIKKWLLYMQNLVNDLSESVVQSIEKTQYRISWCEMDIASLKDKCRECWTTWCCQSETECQPDCAEEKIEVCKQDCEWSCECAKEESQPLQQSKNPFHKKRRH